MLTLRRLSPNLQPRRTRRVHHIPACPSPKRAYGATRWPSEAPLISSIGLRRVGYQRIQHSPSEHIGMLATVAQPLLIGWLHLETVVNNVIRDADRLSERDVNRQAEMTGDAHGLAEAWRWRTGVAVDDGVPC